MDFSLRTNTTTGAAGKEGEDDESSVDLTRVAPTPEVVLRLVNLSPFLNKANSLMREKALTARQKWRLNSEAIVTPVVRNWYSVNDS